MPGLPDIADWRSAMKPESELQGTVNTQAVNQGEGLTGKIGITVGNSPKSSGNSSDEVLDEMLRQAKEKSKADPGGRNPARTLRQA